MANDRDSRDGHGGIGVVVRDAEDRGLGTEELLGPTSLYGGYVWGKTDMAAKGNVDQSLRCDEGMADAHGRQVP